MSYGIEQTQVRRYRAGGLLVVEIIQCLRYQRLVNVKYGQREMLPFIPMVLHEDTTRYPEMVVRGM